MRQERSLRWREATLDLTALDKLQRKRSNARRRLRQGVIVDSRTRDMRGLATSYLVSA